MTDPNAQNPAEIDFSQTERIYTSNECTANIPTELERLAGEVSAKRTELTEATHIAARVPHIQNELDALVAKLRAELPKLPADEIASGLEAAITPENGYAAHY